MTQSAAKPKRALYTQIAASLRAKIEDNHWPVGSMLPSRRDLAMEYNVSSVTVDRAVTNLIVDGLLRADHRRGTFVAHRGGSTQNANNAHKSTPVPAASTLHQPATATVGIVASLYVMSHDHLELNNFMVRMAVQSLEHSLSEDRKATKFFNRVQGVGQPKIPLEQAMDLALATGVDALVIITFDMEPHNVDQSLAAVEHQEVPIVCITTGELRYPMPHIFSDGHNAGYQAAQHLLRGGCRDILFLAPFTASWVKERLEGVKAAVEHAGLPAKTVCVYPPNSDSPWVMEEDPQVTGYKIAKAAFGEGVLGSGVVAANDGIALGYLQAAAEIGYQPGHDFVIVGFDDHPEARHQDLTSLRPPMGALGQEAARQVLQELHGESASAQVRLRWHLIPRGSTCPSRNGPLSLTQRPQETFADLSV